MSNTGLAVVEARWSLNGNHSVRPLFETLAGIAAENPFGFRYDMFCDESSLAKILVSVGGDSHYHSLYLAAHGDENTIYGLDDAAVSRAVFRNRLRFGNANHTITGLYFGSCSICHQNNAEFFLNAEQGCNVNWIAGYSKPVDWIDSSSVDLIFFAKLIQQRQKNFRRKKGKLNDLAMAKIAANEVKSLMPTVFEKLGFNMFYKDGAQELQQIW
jgi:hypothetical protein